MVRDVVIDYSGASSELAAELRRRRGLLHKQDQHMLAGLVFPFLAEGVIYRVPSAVPCE